MAQKKVQPLYSEDHLVKFQKFVRKNPELARSFLSLVGILPTKSVMQKAFYAAQKLSVKKMNILFSNVPFLFNDDGADKSYHVLALHFQKLAEAALLNKTVSCHLENGKITYTIDSETFSFAVSHTF